MLFRNPISEDHCLFLGKIMYLSERCQIFSILTWEGIVDNGAGHDLELNKSQCQHTSDNTRAKSRSYVRELFGLSSCLEPGRGDGIHTSHVERVYWWYCSVHPSELWESHIPDRFGSALSGRWLVRRYQLLEIDFPLSWQWEYLKPPYLCS